MTQEEKAKRYDELLLKLQKAKVDDNVCDEMYYRVIDDIVPELAKSEDERIRKAIHIYFDWLDGRKDYAPKGKYTIRDMIAWLEKQGEQKQDPCDNCKDVMLNCHNFPCVKKRAFKQGKSALEVIKEDGEKITYSETDGYKVEPKFHEGEWLCENEPNNYARFIQILEIVNVQGKERYRISRDIHNDEDVVECRFIENNYHSFTIADAKAGDVLVYKENIKGSNGIKYERICLFNNFDNAFFILTTISNDVEGYDIDVNINYPDDTIPATKEQRDTLEKAMAGVGYTFDFKKKKSKKVEQNSSWSEEDENLLKLSVENLTELKDRFGKDYGRVGDCINCLKSLKDRYAWRASWEQLDALEYHLKHTNENSWQYKETKKLYDQLKKLK